MTEKRKQFLIDVFKNAPIVKTLGMELNFDEKGHAKIYLPYDPVLNNASDITHGGIITAVLDNAGILTCALTREEGTMVTSELSIHFFRPAIKTHLIASGNIIKSGKLQDVAEMNCWDQNDNLIAHAIGTFLAVKN